ncbi:hypothetical protein NPX13_g10872 [Xylaria arbuscula]|uniref:Uncharacterized protein n=1 Tax=Xylaria arbuscula TaxID=114810 RepID=A0A9W8N3X0_9PEZI|nr:hypothetical protein NPX13_g10872 [Xylaria arbuscula]
MHQRLQYHVGQPLSRHVVRLFRHSNVGPEVQEQNRCTGQAASHGTRRASPVAKARSSASRAIPGPKGRGAARGQQHQVSHIIHGVIFEVDVLPVRRALAEDLLELGDPEDVAGLGKECPASPRRGA